VLPSELEVASEAAALASAVSPPADVARDHRRGAAAGGSLRAAVFGVNDGLVSNLSLVMGVAGAAPPAPFILLAGLAGLLAGAFSMAAGEYISVLSQRELLERQLAVERQHIALAPAAERAMLARRYQAKGIAATQAETIADQLMANPEQALDTIAREQLWLDPDDLGSPQAAAAASFVAFALGALLPLLPFVLATGSTAVVASALLSGISLFLVGVGVSWFTGRHALLSGARMLGIGAAAAGLTFLIGRLVGVSVIG
jgi:VIT1/CCC1 family predicted Fe2+/Mn2+ transporter